MLHFASAIQAYITKRRGTLSLSLPSLARELDDYAQIRETTSYCLVKRSKKGDPKGWTPHHEDVWRDWISITFDLKSWTQEVLDPVFGSWKEEWQIEVFDYIGEWTQRTLKLVAAFDKEPLDEVVEELYGGLDPYMVEHGLIKGVYRDSMIKDQED